MTEGVVTIRPRPPVRPWMMYGVALVGMIGAWTMVRYVDQPYRSPSYQRGLRECAGVRRGWRRSRGRGR